MGLEENTNKELSVMDYDDARTIYDPYKAQQKKRYKTVFSEERNSKQAAFLGAVQTFGQKLEQMGVTEAPKLLWGQAQITQASIEDWLGDSMFGGVISNSFKNMAEEDRKAGQMNIMTAGRNIDALIKDQEKRRLQLTRSEADSFVFKATTAGFEYGTALILAYVNPALAIGYLGTSMAGSTAVEGLEQYKKEHPEDTKLTGFIEKAPKEFVLNMSKTYVNVMGEYVLGAIGQLRRARKAVKTIKYTPQKFGTTKAVVRGAIKGAAEEYAEEGLIQNASDTIFDYMLGRYKNKEQAVEDFKANLKDAVYPAMFGSAFGGGSALYARSKAINAAKELLSETVPAKDLDNVARVVVENEIKNIRDVATVSLNISSQLTTQTGEVYDAFKNAAYDAMKASGGYQGMSDEEMMQHADDVAGRFSQEVVGEAIKRGLPVQEVITSKDIVYRNGEIHLAESTDEKTDVDKKIKEAVEKQFQPEQLDLAKEIADIDANNEEYTGETVNIDGVEKTVYNSNGDRIAKSEEGLRAFYNRFGDSKAVDEQGRPLVYNGNYSVSGGKALGIESKTVYKKSLDETKNIIKKLDEIQKATTTEKEVDSVKAQNEGRNVIEFNIESFNDQESMAYMKETAIKKYKMTEKEFEDLAEYMKKMSEEIKDMAEKNGHKMFSRWNKREIARYLNEKGNLLPIISAFKTNGDYPLNFDLSSLCTRREATNAVVKSLIEMGYAQQLGTTQLEALKDILREADYTTACDICFVESKRLRQLAYANSFAYEWQSVRMALGLTDDSEVGTPRKFTPEQEKILSEMTSRKKTIRQQAFDKYIPEERKRVYIEGKQIDSGITPDKMKMIAKLFKQDSSFGGVFNAEWLMSSYGVDWLMRTYPKTDIRSVLSAMYGTATPKPIEGFNIYDPLSWKLVYDTNQKADKLQKVFSIGGFRGQSFSDFNSLQAFDYFQFFCDLAIRHLPIHMYTKVPALIKLFGETGCMFNMSLVPEMVLGVDQEHAGLKPDGKGGWEYAWSKDSFPIEEAYALRKDNRYGGRVGTIAVGVSDAHILKMLDDPNIDMIIPYHISGMPLHTRVKTGLNRAKNYTDFQTTKGPKKGKDFQYNEQLQKIGDPKKTAEAYLNWCKENGYTPKFEQFKDHENYYKLLEDFRGYDNNGNPVLQQSVDMSKIDPKTFAKELDGILTEREKEVARQENIHKEKDVMRKINRLMSKQKIDAGYREALVTRLKNSLGKNNVLSLRQQDFNEMLRRDLEKTRGVEESKRMLEIFRKNDGVVYGYTLNNVIYLNENVFNANTPAHEFTHIWANVAKNNNPELWEDGKALLKESDVWNEVMEDSLYMNIRGNEDAVASEVLSRIVGRENEELIRKSIDPKYKPLKEQSAITSRIMSWFKKLWGEVRSLFDYSRDGKPLTYDEFIHMPLKDLWDETRNIQFNKSLNQQNIESLPELSAEDTYEQTAYAGSRVDYDKPSLEAIGSGEGNQAHGYGLYYALNRDTAEGYRSQFMYGTTESWKRALADFLITKLHRENEMFIDYDDALNILNGKQQEVAEIYKYDTQKANTILGIDVSSITNEYTENQKSKGYDIGQVHEVDIPEMPVLLDEDKTISGQSKYVKDILKSIPENLAKDKSQLASETYESLLAQKKTKNASKKMYGLFGEDYYNALSETLGSDKAASQYLEKLGIKGITYEGRIDGRCFVIFNPKDVNVIQKFYQVTGLKGKKIKRGEYNVSKKAIKLFEGANTSTLPHELAHYWLDSITDFATSGRASQEYMAQYESVMRYLGVPVGEKLKDLSKEQQRKAHEKFATSYEKYVMRGIFPTPAIGRVFDGYDKWLKNVYGSLAEISKRSRIKSTLTPQMVQFFDSMTTGELPDVSVDFSKQEEVETRSKEIDNNIKETEVKLKEISRVKEENRRKVMTPVQTDTKTGYLTAYKKMTGEKVEAGSYEMKDQYEKAKAFVESDIDRAKRVVEGVEEKPEGILMNAIYIAYNDYQKSLGNTADRAKALLNQALELRAMGQEIAYQRVAYDSTFSKLSSPTYWIEKVISEKEQVLAEKAGITTEELNNLIDKKIEEGVNQGKTAKEIAQEISDETGLTLMQEEDVEVEKLEKTFDSKIAAYRYAYSYVNKRIGKAITEQEALEITQRADAMLMSLENSIGDNGNPSLDYFKKLSDMEAYANSLSPSSLFRVYADLIGPTNLMMSIKTPLFNIEANIPVALLRMVGRRAKIGQYKSIVEIDVIKNYMKRSLSLFAQTGYNLSTMTSEAPEKTILGEKTTHFEGIDNRGLRWIAQKYNEFLKWGIGGGDIIFKDLAFVDSVSLKATKMANGDVKKANELFEDAVRVEPKTDEGKAIRLEAMTDALLSTYQNNGLLSTMSLKVREGLNVTGLGKFFIAFAKTPANVIAYSAKKTFDPFIDLGKLIIKGKASVPNIKETFAESALAYLISAAIVFLGTDDDDYMPPYALASEKDRQLARDLNIPYNSVRFGDTWYSLDIAGPLGGIVSGMLQARREEGMLGSAAGFLTGSGLQLLSVPAIGGVSTISEKGQQIIDDIRSKKADEAAMSLIDSLVDTVYSRTVPAISSDIAKALDPYEREAKGLEKIQKKIPIARNLLEKKVSQTTGEAEKRGGDVSRVLVDLFVGARIKEQIVNNLSEEFLRLNYVGEGVSLGDVTRSGDLRNLDDDKKADVRREFAEEFSNSVNKIINRNDYAKKTDEEKKNAINDIRKGIVKKLKKKYKNFIAK